MGSSVEINDTLQITVDQGFPQDVLDRESHVRNPVMTNDLQGRVFAFKGKRNARLFQLAPVRVYFVHNIGGKWLFWGKIAIIEQTISQTMVPGQPWKEGEWETAGKYTVLEIYDPAYQEIFTKRESPSGLSYF